MRRLVAILPIVGLVVVGLMLTAHATDWEDELGAECVTFHDHSGFIPGSYDVAVLIEDGFDPVVVETHGEDIYVPPPAGRKSWDTVLKCNYRTTTTTSSQSTSSTQPSTTTTGPSSSTSEPVTSTSVAETTTTEGITSTTALSSTTTQPPGTSSAVFATSTSGPTSLPLTGGNWGLGLLSALGLSALGGLVVRGNRDDAA